MKNKESHFIVKCDLVVNWLQQLTIYVIYIVWNLGKDSVC